MEIKVGDKFICKKRMWDFYYCYLWEGTQYQVIEISHSSSYGFIYSFNDNLGQRKAFNLDQLYKYFYSPSELRKSKLVKLKKISIFNRFKLKVENKDTQ